ncbi:MAG: hypothetical protein ABIM99_06260 [Candidatus Dojkabacteria bacterium]
MNRRKLLTAIGALLLLITVGAGIYLASQAAQNDQSATSAFACNGWACGCGKCGCGDDKDITSCVPGNPPPLPPAQQTGDCGGVGAGNTRCDGNGKEKKCSGGQMVFTGNCCPSTPNCNSAGGTVPPVTGSNTCSGAGNASKCFNIGDNVPISGGSCTCVRTTGTLCGCKVTTGTSACVTQTNGCAAVGAACSVANIPGTCVTDGYVAGSLSCSCKLSGTANNGGGQGASCATSTTPCASGLYCNGTSCAAKKAFGGSCSGANECLSGICSNSGTSGKTCANSTSTGSGSNGGSTAGSVTAGSNTSGTTSTCTPFYGNGSVSIPNTPECAGFTLTCQKYVGPSNSGTCSETSTGSVTVHAGESATVTAACGQCAQIDCMPGQGGSRVNNNSTCTSSTTGGSVTTGGTTVSSAPYCGDGVCATGELCEATAKDGTTFKACGTVGSSPSGASVPACYGTTYKQPVQSTTCKYCGDSVYTSGTEQCDATAPATGGNNAAQCDASCHLQNIANACVSMTENGVDPIRSGASNYVEYTLIYQHNSTSNPFPNIRLLVSSGNTVATAVGRDANSTSSALVAPIPVGGYSYDAVTSRHTYIFRWESVSTGGVAVPDATYQVRGLTDGTDAGIITSPGSCTESLTASAVAVEEPLFSIIKTAAQFCVDNSDATVNYTVTVTNNGPVTGVVDFVTDTLDPLLTTLGITPTNLSPATGVYAAGVITWTGDVTARTYTTGQSKTFTYSILIPVGQLLNFSGGVQNLATVQYDTNTTSNNTQSFNLRTQLNCTINGIPITGVFDDGRLFLFGLIFIMLGFIAYRYQLGKTISEKLISGAVSTAEGGVEKLMPFEDRIERKMEKRMKKEE